jgi:hypothetical protein
MSRTQDQKYTRKNDFQAKQEKGKTEGEFQVCLENIPYSRETDIL